jgi:hypothetical protein
LSPFRATAKVHYITSTSVSKSARHQRIAKATTVDSILFGSPGLTHTLKKTISKGGWPKS